MNNNSNASLATNQAGHKLQFFKMTAERVKADYKEKLITAEAYILYLLDIHRSVGWKWTIEPKSFCRVWDIPRSTFYRAISNLKSKGKLNWEVQGMVTLWRGSDIGMQDSLIHETNVGLISKPCNSVSETTSLIHETAKLIHEITDSCMDKQEGQTLVGKEVENATDIKQKEADSIESDTLPLTPSHELPLVAPLRDAPTAIVLGEKKRRTNFTRN